MILSEVEIPQLDAAVRARGYALEIGCSATWGTTQPAAILYRYRTGQRIDAAPVPHIALTQDRRALIAALDAGAADAVVDPVDPDELAARLDVSIRRRTAMTIRIGALQLDPVARTASRSGAPIALLPREFALVRYLAECAGRFVSRRELLEQVWGLRFDPGTNVVAVHVSNLRAKLDRPFPTAMIEGRKGLGYRLIAG